MNEAAYHALSRFGLGAASGEAPPAEPRGWLAAQLEGADPALASGRFRGLADGAGGLAAMRSDRRERQRLRAAGIPLKGHFKSEAYRLFRDDARVQIDWAVQTRAPFRERLVWFWTNHFTVSIRQGGVAALVGAFIREAIRPHVTGTFPEMVLAVERHPAMLLYLSNAGSIGPDSKIGRRTRRGLNENLGRECMELHTVGLASGYTQADVISMARLLTGWSVSPDRPPTGFLFRSAAHEPGPQTLLGKEFPPGEAGGIEALRFLATYPTTWDALARKLVRHFVADDPPAPAVRNIAAVLSATGGNLADAARALIDLPEAWRPLAKLKTPLEYVVSVGRAIGPTAGHAPHYPAVLRKLGQPLWAAPLPNGWSDRAADWAGSDAVLARIGFGHTAALRARAPNPVGLAEAMLGPLLRPETATAMRRAGSRQEAVSLLFASPEFQRR
ncbi:MAG: DUF1800 domain-containing protein [Acetobacteraceae bacterium]